MSIAERPIERCALATLRARACRRTYSVKTGFYAERKISGTFGTLIETLAIMAIAFPSRRRLMSNEERKTNSHPKPQPLSTPTSALEMRERRLELEMSQDALGNELGAALTRFFPLSYSEFAGNETPVHAKRVLAHLELEAGPLAHSSADVGVVTVAGFGCEFRFFSSFISTHSAVGGHAKSNEP